jgi:plastocyanin
MGPRLLALSVSGMMTFATPILAAETIRVSIDKLKFSPAEVSAHVGDTIEWVSSDFVSHTASARDKEWDVAIPAKGTGRVTLQHAGDVDYFCRFHPTMTGRISVAPE